MSFSRGRATWIAIPIAIAGSVWLGCGSGSQGDPGPAGAAGAAGPNKTGTNGPSGSSGASASNGDPGAQGGDNTSWFRTTVATPGADITTPNTVDAGTWGPFNLSGHCYFVSEEIEAQLYLSSTDPNAKYSDYGTDIENGSFPPDAGGTPVEYSANATPPDSDLEGPWDGTFSALSMDLKTYISGAASTGVLIGGDAGPACQFDGYVTQSP
ncbi:MAG: hypothetical protein ACRELY_00780 [Polyangiaceae bacterium]